MQHLYVEIPGGDHSFFVSRNPEVVGHLFSFFGSSFTSVTTTVSDDARIYGT